MKNPRVVNRKNCVILDTYVSQTVCIGKCFWSTMNFLFQEVMLNCFSGVIPRTNDIATILFRAILACLLFFNVVLLLCLVFADQMISIALDARPVCGVPDAGPAALAHTGKCTRHTD